MLEGLEEIPWGKLSHAYGKAHDVPDQLRALLSPDAETRQNAMRKLCGNIFHQGTRYEASAHAIPFLFEMLIDPATLDRAAILDLVLSLALGYAEEYLPEGLNPQEAFGDGKSRWSRWLRKCYRAFADRWQTVATLTQDADAAVRLLAVYALAWLPKQAQASAEIARRLLAEEHAPIPHANLLLTLGLLGRYRQDATDASLAQAGLAEGEPPVVRLASAISLVTMRAENVELAFDVILAGLQLPQEALAPAEQTGLTLPFNGSDDLVGYAATTLLWMPAGNETRIAEALGSALPAAPTRRALVMTRVLLRLVFGTPSKTRRVWGDLTPLQQQVVRAIGASGGWRLGDRSFGNYGWLVREYGLPGDWEAYQAFLQSD